MSPRPIYSVVLLYDYLRILLLLLLLNNSESVVVAPPPHGNQYCLSVYVCISSDGAPHRAAATSGQAERTAVDSDITVVARLSDLHIAPRACPRKPYPQSCFNSSRVVYQV